MTPFSTNHLFACLAAAFALALAGCGSTGGGGSDDDGDTVSTTASRFVTPAPDGTISLTLSESQSTINIDTDGDGYSLLVGADNDAFALTAVAGVVGADSLTPAAGSGQVTYDGNFEILHVDRASSSDATATVREIGGTMLLIADFDVDQFAGESRAVSGTDPLLSVSGTVGSGGVMTGTVRYVNGSDEISGTLDGAIGADKAVGAFHGTTDADAIAGGFLLPAD